jgi:hypothetical protein
MHINSINISYIVNNKMYDSVNFGTAVHAQMIPEFES